jgi:uncharacterized protein DUF397
MTHPTSRRWRTSSYSGSNNNCIQAATSSPGIALRDSKHPHGPVLTISSHAWRDFIQAIKDNATPRHQS